MKGHLKTAVKLIIASCLVMLLLPSLIFAALIEVTEDINSNTTWISGNTYYVNMNHLYITDNAKLTIEQGAVVKIKPEGNITFTAGSSCAAIGTIYITSRDDNSVGENAPGSDGTPEPGDWNFVEFLSNESGGTAVAEFSYVKFRYGGHSGVTNFWGMVRIQGAKGTFQSCDFWQSAHAGIDADILFSRVPEISVIESAFRDNNAYGIELGDIYGTNLIMEPIISQCFFSNNKTAAICFRQNVSPNWGNAENEIETMPDVKYNGIEYTGIISRNITWNKPGTDFPYCADMFVATAGRLTIGAGVIIKMARDALTVQPGGMVVANGVSGEPVIVTSLKDDAVVGDTNGDAAATAPQPGDWDSWVLLSDNMSAARGVFNWTKFRYGGHSGVTNFMGMIQALGSSVSCNNCDFWKSAFCGAQAEEANNRAPEAEFIGCTFRENNGGGLRFGSIYQTTKPFMPLISGCHFSANGEAAIIIRYNVFPDWGNASNTVDKSKGKGMNAVAVNGSIIFSGAWNMPGKDFPYYIAGGVNVQDGTTLEFGAGTIVKLGGAPTIIVQPGGVLNFNGEADNPIYVTSVKDDARGGDTNGDGALTSPAPGDWTGMMLQNDSNSKRASGVFQYTNFLYGGGGWGMLRIAGCAPVIKHCEFHYSSEWAITCWRDNNLPPEATISQCVISGNKKGIENQDALYCLDATNNDWGHYSGPKDASNVDDCADYYSPKALGDSVSDNVLVRPWIIPQGIKFLEVNTNLQARAVVKNDATLSIEILTNNVEVTDINMTIDLALAPGASINADKSTHPHPFTAETFSGGVFTYYIDLGETPQTGVVVLNVACDQASESVRIPIRIEQKPAGDVNHDDAIDSADVVTLVNQILGR